LKKVLILYNYFLPAYKAGGPIQSIANLVRSESNNYKFYIICGDTDHKQKQPLEVTSGTWTNFEDKAQVYYLPAKEFRIRKLRQLINAVAPDIIFANGLYSIPFSILPVWLSSRKTILSVRGMLHSGALAQKRLKKRMFLTAFKLLRLHKKVIFHATDNIEKQFVIEQFGKSIEVRVAGNFPHIQNYSVPIDKKEASIILGSIGLISPMKNHHLVLKALRNCRSAITYYIYGPVKQEDYWEECKLLIRELPENVKVEYKGEVPPPEISDKLKEFHYFILPSKSENFGHAIFEALSAGRPCITSYFTPWNNLEKEKAGYNVDISNIATITQAIEDAASQNEEDYRKWSKSARDYAIKTVDIERLENQYKQLFLG
jgi:glycosyltransferase involved in cell wall biosynthesis